MSTIAVEFFDRELFRTTDIIDEKGNTSFVIPLEIEGMILSVYNESTGKKLLGFDCPYEKTSTDILTISTTDRHWAEDKKEKRNQHKFAFIFRSLSVNE